MHRIDGPGATVDNKFTDGNPTGGVSATVVTDDWLNDVQEELLSILAAVQITPVKGTQNQVLAAIRRLSGGYSAIAPTAVSLSLGAGNIGQFVIVTAAGTTQTLPPVTNAPSGSSIVFGIFGAATIKGNGSELITNIYGTASSNTIQVAAGERITLTSNGLSWYISAYDRADAGAPIGSASNVKMSVATPSATATLSADEVVVGVSLGGQSYRLSGFSKSLNLSATGAGGMDTGTAPVSGFVAIYAIYNPTTGASALLATNAATLQSSVYSGANMPAGYTASALVSVWPTTPGSAFAAGYQADRTVSFGGKSVLSGGTAVTATATSIASAVPRNAKTCAGYAINNAANGVIQIGADANYSGGGLVGVGNVSPATAPIWGWFATPIITPQTIYYAATQAASQNGVIWLSSYTF
jgi:hypothetical protein